VTAAGTAAPRTRRGGWVVDVALGVVGAVLAVACFASVTFTLGPVDVEASLHLARTGGADVELQPIGGFAVDATPVPVRLRVRPVAVDAATARSLLASLTGDKSDAADLRPGAADVRAAAVRGVVMLVTVTLVAATVTGAVLAAVVRRRRRSAVGGAVGAAAVVVVAAVVVAVSLAADRPRDVDDVRVTGALASVVERAELFEDRLASYEKSVPEVAGVYADTYVAMRRASGDPLLTSPDVIRVVHLSDLHLSAAGSRMSMAVARSFDADLIVNTGDDVNWGSAEERGVVGSVADVGVPYVWIRGNHDSLVTQEQVRAEGATVLDDAVTEIAGLRIYGIGDPTSAKRGDTSVVEKGTRGRKREWSTSLAERIAAFGPLPDVLLVHDDAMAHALDALPPTVLSGHYHRFEVKSDRGGVIVRMGTSGGAGLRVFDRGEEQPMQVGVLYFDRTSKRLLAIDLVSNRSLSRQEFTIERIPVPTPQGTPP
jgi:predicted phosphodiesterase